MTTVGLHTHLWIYESAAKTNNEMHFLQKLVAQLGQRWQREFGHLLNQQHTHIQNFKNTYAFNPDRLLPNHHNPFNGSPLNFLSNCKGNTHHLGLPACAPMRQPGAAALKYTCTRLSLSQNFGMFARSCICLRCVMVPVEKQLNIRKKYSCTLTFEGKCTERNELSVRQQQ